MRLIQGLAGKVEIDRATFGGKVHTGLLRGSKVPKMSESDPKVFLICLKVVSRWTASGSLIGRDGKNPG